LSFIKDAYGLIILFLTAKNFSSGKSELLSIAISKNFRNKYYGKKLIRKLEFYLKKKNKKEYIVKLEFNNKRAINFYLSNKFKQTLKTNYPLYEVIYLKKKL
jgi:ribosomal protein S18 acetylase RimI-like enzyme